jgi:hypothetical protein
MKITPMALAMFAHDFLQSILSALERDSKDPHYASIAIVVFTPHGAGLASSGQVEDTRSALLAAVRALDSEQPVTIPEA